MLNHSMKYRIVNPIFHACCFVSELHVQDDLRRTQQAELKSRRRRNGGSAANVIFPSAPRFACFAVTASRRATILLAYKEITEIQKIERSIGRGAKQIPRLCSR
jgi:hypothetical protein